MENCDDFTAPVGLLVLLLFDSCVVRLKGANPGAFGLPNFNNDNFRCLSLIVPLLLEAVGISAFGSDGARQRKT